MYIRVVGGGSLEQDLVINIKCYYLLGVLSWKMIGVYLEISDLDSIETKHHGDSHLCLVVLDTWLKRVDPPPTWSAVIEAAEFLEEGEKKCMYCLLK